MFSNTIKQNSLVTVHYTRAGKTYKKVARVAYVATAWIAVFGASETDQGLESDEMGNFDPISGVRVNGLLPLGADDYIEPAAPDKLLSDDELLDPKVALSAHWRLNLLMQLNTLSGEQRLAVLTEHVQDETLLSLLKMRLAAGYQTRKTSKFIADRLKIAQIEVVDLEVKAYNALRQSLKAKAGDLSHLPAPQVEPDPALVIPDEHKQVTLEEADLSTGMIKRLKANGVSTLSQLDGISLSQLTDFSGIEEMYATKIFEQVERYTGQPAQLVEFQIDIPTKYRRQEIKVLGLEDRATLVLKRAGFLTLGQLVGETDLSLKRNHEIGSRTIQLIKDAVESLNQTL